MLFSFQTKLGVADNYAHKKTEVGEWRIKQRASVDDSKPPFVCFKSLKNCLMLSHCKSDIGDFDKLFHISQALPFKHYRALKVSILQCFYSLYYIWLIHLLIYPLCLIWRKNVFEQNLTDFQVCVVNDCDP